MYHVPCAQTCSLRSGGEGERVRILRPFAPDSTAWRRTAHLLKRHAHKAGRTHFTHREDTKLIRVGASVVFARSRELG